jgi:hypothetical protein
MPILYKKRIFGWFLAIYQLFKVTYKYTITFISVNFNIINQAYIKALHM